MGTEKIRVESWWRHFRSPGAEPETAAGSSSYRADGTAGIGEAGPGRSESWQQSPPPPHVDYADLFEHAPVGYVLLDEAGCIATINRAGATALGWDQAWLSGKPFSRWVVNNDKQIFHAYLRKLHSRDECISQELRIKNRQGRFVTLRLQGARENESSAAAGGCRCIMLDISGEERSARRLRRLQSQLTHVARVHTAGELASSLAHELNQPLGTVVLNCEAAMRLLNSGSSEEFEFAEALTQATEAASFASDVIRHLRGFLRKNGELHQVCKLAHLIRDVATLIEIDARDHDIDLQIDIEHSLPVIRVDPVQIEQVLVNLARNSIEAISEKGGGPNRVIISAREGSNATQSGTHIQVSVSDTGPGLPTRHIDRVFSPFFTTKPDGMGMGLSISRTIIEAHGGRLWVDSESGSGAVMHFTLPVVELSQHDD